MCIHFVNVCVGTVGLGVRNSEVVNLQYCMVCYGYTGSGSYGVDHSTGLLSPLCSPLSKSPVGT